MAPARCQYCRKFFPTPRAVNHHISASKTCSQDWRNDLFGPDNPSPSPSPKRRKKESTAEVEGREEGNLALDYDLGIGDDFVMPPSPTRHSVDEEEDGGGGVTYPTCVHECYIESYPGDAGKGLRQSKTI
jgi:hypothetical protein